MSAEHLQASLRLRREFAELAEQFLLGQGALAVTLTDTGDASIWEPRVGETPLWQEVTVTGLFPAQTDTAALAAALSLLPGVGAAGQVDISGLPGRDWERAWMDRFRPMQFGERLWIVPTGMQCPQDDAVQLHLDPGLAFGTGTHPTTRLCLEWLEAQAFDGASVLDFGCGSGVLGIAAALCGATRVLCVDNDPQAITATRENASRNGVAGRVEALRADSPPAGQWDMVVSNILAGILVDLAAPLQAAVREGGRLALTGILAEQADAVRAAYGDRFPHLQARSEGQWVLLAGGPE